jgi:hypothetical protein
MSLLHPLLLLQYSEPVVAFRAEKIAAAFIAGFLGWATVMVMVYSKSHCLLWLSANGASSALFVKLLLVPFLTCPITIHSIFEEVRANGSIVGFIPTLSSLPVPFFISLPPFGRIGGGARLTPTAQPSLACLYRAKLRNRLGYSCQVAIFSRAYFLGNGIQ